MTAVVRNLVEVHSAQNSPAGQVRGSDIGFNARRLRANLCRNAAAMTALATLGIERALVERLGLGIKEPYVTAAGVEVSGVLTYPLEFEGGRRRYGYLNLDGVTCKPQHPVAWNPGPPRTFRLGELGVLLVVASPMTLFRARSAIERQARAVAVVASSQPDRVPQEWLDPGFWAPWERIVFDDGLPSAIKLAVASAASRTVEIAAGVVMDGGSQTEMASVLDDWLEGMLSEARPFAVKEMAVDTLVDGVGDFAAVPLPLHGGVSNGLMYYPFTIERRRRSAGAMLLCSYETLVVRTDGLVLEARMLPAPAGTSQANRVHCLSDGTRIIAAPQSSMHSTWSFEAIQAYVADRAAGLDPVSRDPASVVADVHAYLSSRVCLPDPDDLWVATVFTVLGHFFRVFPAIPLLLVVGPPGSGKSELASAVASLGFNGVMMGQGSAATLVRIAQEGGGLVVLDDVEGLSAGGAGYGELSQCLKVGYRASTARKPITLGGGRVSTFDFYGPRLLTCTRGVEPILRSRCVSISTLAAPQPIQAYDIDTETLRDELHALGMSRSREVADAFARSVGGLDDRAAEIWTPMQTIASALCPAAAMNAIRRARARHTS